MDENPKLNCQPRNQFPVMIFQGDFNAKTDIKNDLNHNNLGLTVGGGISIPRGKNYFLFDARVSYGLRSIQKDTVRNGDSRTGNLVISVGYAFGFK